MKALSFFVFCMSCFAYASQMMAQDDEYTYTLAAQKDRIAIDGGLIIPFGDVGKGLGLQTAWGVNLNFWKFISERSFGVVTVGKAWYTLGTEVQTDSGIQDLSQYSMSTTPLLGGIGYVFGHDVLHPYVIAHAGVTFVTAYEGKNRPLETINNEAYFTLGGTAGLGYSVSEHFTVMASARYMKTFGEDLQTISILFGVSYRL